MGHTQNLDTLIQRLDGPARAICEAVIEQYEQELGVMTEQLGQAYEELLLLYAVGDEIATTLDTTTVADRAITRTCELLEATDGFVVLLRDEADRLDGYRVLGSAALPDDLAPLIGWATQQAAERGRALIVDQFGQGGVPLAPSVASLISAPVRARDRVVGAVHVFDKSGPDGFNTEDQMLLQAIASQVGTAIENSRLFQQEQQRSREVAEALQELELTYDDTLEALSGALDLRDNETEGHARRVTRYSVRMAEQMGVDGQMMVDIERGALMHDIGKIGVPDAILLKPAKLTDEEWAVMRTHPTLGYQMIRNIRFLAGAAPIVLHHHERADGKGYPAGLVGTDIPLGARIFAVADTYDAMTSDRPYRKALPHDEAREEIVRCSGSQFDPDVVAAFERVPAAELALIRLEVDTELAAKRRTQEEVESPA